MVKHPPGGAENGMVFLFAGDIQAVASSRGQYDQSLHKIRATLLFFLLCRPFGATLCRPFQGLPSERNEMPISIPR